MKKHTTIQMKKDVYNLLKEHCKEQRRSISGYVEYLVLESLKKPMPDKVLRVKQST